jgi:type I restriction enzyme M protein
MITGDLKNRIDQIWDAFWSGGIANPLTVVEQITYLLFIKRLDELETQREAKQKLGAKDPGKPLFGPGQQDFRWSRFKDLAPQQMYELFTRADGVFAYIKNLNANGGSTYAKLMENATFMIPTPSLLDKVVQMLDAIPMQDRDTKGDVYEYILSALASSGKNGQFRTPRHIINMMVDIVDPKPTDLICDPASGTCGFLMAAGEYLREHHADMFYDTEQVAHFNKRMFTAFDFDATMLRIGAMNMLLHGIDEPTIEGRDSLSQEADMEEQFTLILANPPFKGSINAEDIAKNLKSTVSTKKTELLFVALFLRLLKPGGRAAVIVPDGVLFGSSKAHKSIRELLVDGHKLDAVISMPSGVFKPYAGVSTAVLVFTKTNSGGTDKVWFYDMQADGFSLDDKRTPLDAQKHEENNIPDIVSRWKNREAEETRARTDQSFLVPAEEIREKAYDLSINRYKEIVHEEIEYDPPQKIIEELEGIEQEIQDGLRELKEMLQ